LIVVAVGDGPVDLGVAAHTLGTVARLVENSVIFDLHAAVSSAGNNGLYAPQNEIGPDGIGVVSLVGK